MAVLEGVKNSHPELHWSCSRGSTGALRGCVLQVVTKTSIMLGLGETDQDVRDTMRDLLAAGVMITHDLLL